jgi:hypothetical protein
MEIILGSDQSFSDFLKGRARIFSLFNPLISG